ncbi:hypothetical protein ABBQ38_009779 [Trebouxia sp. C0009 RCD-2024]
MAYAVMGTAFQPVVQAKSTAQSRKASRLTHAIVRSHLTQAQTAKKARGAVQQLATTVSAAAVLLAMSVNAGQAASLFEGNTAYQQELQDLIDKRGSLPSVSPPDLSNAASKVKRAAEKSEFRLPDVSKGAVETPKVLENVLTEAVKNVPDPPTPTPSSSTPGQLKAETPMPPTPKLEAPKLDVPKPPSPPQPSALPQQEGSGLPTSYLAAGGVAALAIVGIGLAGAKPDEAPSSPVKSSGSHAPKSSGSSSSSMPEGKDPELSSEEARKKDPFFEQVKKRTK